MIDLEKLMPAGRGMELAQQYTWLIWLLAVVYVPFVYTLQYIMRRYERLSLKWPMIIWNASLSLLSWAGWYIMTTYMGRDMLQAVYLELDFPAPVRLVTTAFCLTKSIEYGDTVFLVLAKKPLIFLHVWHHITVALYCWHAQSSCIGFGHVFCYINLFIHGIMYGYYALSVIFKNNVYVRKLRVTITLLQLLQMVFGLGITMWAGRALDLEPAHAINCTAATLMYLSYLYLFGLFYIQNYMKYVKNAHVVAIAFTIAIFSVYVAAIAVIDYVEVRTIATVLAIVVAFILSYTAQKNNHLTEISIKPNPTPVAITSHS